MKIGVMLRHVTQQRGGIGTYTDRLLEHLLAIDPRDDYLLMYAGDEAAGRYGQRPNVREVILSAANSLAWDQVAVARAARRYKLEAVFNPKLSVPLFTSAKTVFVMHGADWFAYPQNYKLHDRIYHSAFASLYLRKADAIISVSHDASRRILEHTRLPERKVRTIHHGVDVCYRPIADHGLLGHVRTKYGLPDQFFLFAGQIYPMKNFSGILRAYAQVRGQLPHKLVVIGKPSLKFKHELALLEQLGLGEDVMFAGWVPEDEVPVFYNLATALVFPSFYEGFGLPIVEAMACGCPVVTSTAGSCPEVAGDAALLVEPSDTGAIAEAILRVAADPALREAMRSKGLVRARQFSWERCARETLEVLRSL